MPNNFQLMKSRLIFCLALVLSGGCLQTIQGYQEPAYQINRTNLNTDYSFLSIKAAQGNQTNGAGEIFFTIKVLPKGGHQPEHFRGYLEIYDGEKRVVGTPVAHSEFPKAAGADFVEFSFIVSTRYLAHSEFRLTESVYPSSGVSYSFKLVEFTNTK